MKNLLLPIFALLLLAGCGTAEEMDSSGTVNQTEKTGGPLEIFTTVYPLGYFTERIGGEHVNVRSIYPPGSNVHTFEPTQQDMIALAEADALFYIGLGMEGFIDNAKESLKDEKVEMIAASRSIPETDLLEGHSHSHEEHAHQEEHTNGHGHEEGEASKHESSEEPEGTSAHSDHQAVDPHIWLSPQLSQKLAEAIKDELIEQDRANQAEYETNYTDLMNELKELDQSFERMAESATKKSFFISHESFGYIANAYELEQVAVAGLNSEDEPSQKELTHIVELAKDKEIEYIAFEQNVSSKISEVIRQEIGAEAVQLHNLSVLTQENLNQEETYFTLMEENIAAFEKMLK